VVRAALADAAARLRDAGVASPEHDAAALLAHVLGTTRGRLPLAAAPTAEQQRRLDDLLERRCSREPLQHLLGRAAFRHIEVEVGPGVFVPRPETELLAGWAVEQVAVLDRPLVVDLGTGSGAIAKAVAFEAPHARVVAVERERAALTWARRNLADTGVEVVEGDLADALPELDGSVDVVVSNPPYVPLEAWESVAPEARDHDPHAALFSGADGLDAIRVLERRCARLLRAGGRLGVEHADVQGESAPAVFSGSGRWAEVRDHRDLAGRPRFVTARLARYGS
jgi:release factor glutamine methyltransferase